MGVKQEPVPIKGNAGGLEAWGSGLNKAWRQSPHESRCLYLRGGEGAVKGMPVTCGWESVQGTSRRLGGKVAGVSAEAGSTGPGGGGYGGPLSLP